MTTSSSNPVELRSKFESALRTFANGPSTFEIVYTAGNPPPTTSPFAQTSTLRTLYVLDSSFNPPSRAHLTILRKGVLLDKGPRPCRVCLLLATVNADKKQKPAALEDRLVMMSLMAEKLRASLSADDQASSVESSESEDIDVDVAVTKKPFFMDKAASIDDSGVYGAAQQLHITGYDTITRIFNAKYYPEDQKLRVLDPFLSKHRLRVCYRESASENDAVPSREEQEKYVKAVGDGSRADEGMKKEWRAAIELVDDAESVNGVSSTKARKAAVEGAREDLEDLVGKEVAEYVLEQKLYV